MARKPRIEYEGAIYHIMSRGNRGDAIFLDDRDRETFLDTLEEACMKTGWLVHAFCLMGNHYHLLLETPEANLVTGMKWLQGTYTQRFNSRHKLWGHLLQGRYKALLVEGAGGEYFSTVASYIHLNPARAKLFDLEKGRLTDYRWSSYPLYFRPSKRPSWLAVERTLGAMGRADERSGREAFRRTMQKRVQEIAGSDRPQEVDTQWGKIRRGWCFGSEQFRDDLLERLDGVIGSQGRRESFSGEEVRAHDEAEAVRLLEAGLRILGLKPSGLADMRKNAPEKQVLAWLLRSRTVVANQWITEHLHCGHSCNVSAFVGNVKRADRGPLMDLRNRLI
ncbi:MAG: transposase [Pontiellaceae bacterium]|nr:transposase [Pontiellaceae bacterium]MBN2785108.1 transposase [Pontiellaceae bacterium]